MFKYLLYLSLIVPIFGFSQHQIKGTFSPATEFKATMLYHLSAGQCELYYVRMEPCNPNGVVQIDLEASMLLRAVYRLVYALASIRSQ